MRNEPTRITGEVRVQGPQTLRDLLAAAALTGLTHRHGARLNDEVRAWIGRQAYAIADAALKERRR